MALDASVIRAAGADDSASDGDPPGDGEFERLRRENAALDAQVKLLVQLEQRLSRSQLSLDQELRRIRALSAFSLGLASTRTCEALVHAACLLLRECFNLDRLAVVRWDAPAGAACGAGPLPFSTIELSSVEGEYFSGLRGVVLAELTALPAPLGGVFERLCRGQLRMECLVLPAHPMPIAVLAASVPSRHAPERDEQLSQRHRPFLDLVGTHIERAFENLELQDRLQERSRLLAEVNARLTESLQRLESTQARLIERSKMEALGRLAGGVAHEFNNLLTVILNHAELAAGEVANGRAATDDLQQVVESAKRAGELTAQLLALGRRQIRRGDVLDLGRLAQDTCRMLRSMLPREIVLRVDAEAGCAVLADRGQLEQALMHLVLNARDALATGGEIRVLVRSATGADDGEPGVTGEPADQVVLEVIDDGAGMDPDTKARIFEPFFTTKGQGREGRGDALGLGLAVVYGVVTHAGGQISVNSELGAGTRVSILLPRQRAARVSRGVVRGGARVLVVDDNDAVRRGIVRTLARAGYEVVEAGDGVDALAKVESSSSEFDLVLTDLNMPRMGGFELAGRLALAHPSTRLMLMTGFPDELVGLTRRAPQWPCVSKPFTPSELLGQVRDRLSGA